MSDTSVTKVQSKHSPRGEMGQKHLATGIHLSMRLWEKEQPGDRKPPSSRDYETVGYVIEGRAELHLEGQMVLLEPGDSWVVPKGRPTRTRFLNPSPPWRPPIRRPWFMDVIASERGSVSLSQRGSGRHFFCTKDVSFALGPEKATNQGGNHARPRCHVSRRQNDATS